MEKIDFKDYPDTTTPIDANNLNIMQDNAEASITNLKNQVANGWYEIDPTAVLTFSSWDASVYTGVVSTNIDLTPYLSVGMKVKFTQNAVVKYGIIIAITSTQITLYMGTNYTLLNAVITNAYYSMLKTPYGWDNYSMDNNFLSAVYSSTSNFIITPAGSYVKYPLNQVNASCGSKLKLSNNDIVVGEGVKALKIDAYATVVFGTATSVVVAVFKNGVSVGANQISSSSTATNQNVHMASFSFYVSVQENDVISLMFYSVSGTNNKVQRNTQCSLSARVIE